jgi:hypothetical protein
MRMINALPVRRALRAALVLIQIDGSARLAAPYGALPPSSPAAKSTPGAEMSSDRARNCRVLAEFGPYRTEAEAATTFENALRALVDQGGGILVIPRDAPATWYPRNRVQAAFGTPGVTVLDARGGVERVYVPPLGTTASDGLRGGNLLIERDASATFPWQGTYSTEAIVSRFRGGASSYLDRLARPASRGRDSRLYVMTLRGLFPGQVLCVTARPDDLGGEGERVTVKSLGLDGIEPFIVADTTSDHPRAAVVYNKNVVNGLTISDTANCDNQSMTLSIEKSIFGAGDSFVVSALLNYQGNVMSAAGDEGGLCYAGDIVQDPQAFWGEVESWDRAARSLVYKPGALHPQKLGTSRPIINMNPKKWVRRAKVLVVPPGYTYLREESANVEQPLLVAPGGAGWDQSLVGRFLAIDEPTESYAADEALSFGYAGTPGRQLHQWWHITALERRPDGRWNVFVERTAWWTTRRGGPALLRFSNYSTDGNHLHPLACIVAPGAWASDVRDAVCGDQPGLVGVAGPNDRRTIALAPSPQAGTAVDFEPSDPITQPLGADVWQPTGVRIRHHQGYPGIIGDASFSSYNAGKTQVQAAIEVNAASQGKLDEVLARQKDGRPPYGAGITLHAATGTGLEIRGPVEQAAIDLWEYDGNRKPIQWRLPSRVARLHVDPNNADLVFSGGNLDIQGQGVVRQGGVSATTTPARNLRGIAVRVPGGAKRLTVRFDQPEADPAYSVVVQENWFTLDRVTKKRADGFDVEFAEPAPEDGALDWQLVR